MSQQDVSQSAAAGPHPRLVLASASPRRASLLSAAGFDFVVHPAHVDEDNTPASMLPAEVARHLAVIKAEAVANQFPEDVVLGADTVVAFGDMLLGKPANADAARQMLQLLSGTTHLVITGIAVIHRAGNYSRSGRVISAVHMRPLSPGEIERYLAGGEWQGKAGSYGIQDPDPFVTRMSGSHTNIVGLPMAAARHLLAEAGIVPVRPRTAGSGESTFGGI